ncbi:hypothetical protein F4680DRAFT_448336 [Xylaria scruposa]|nr:hypothetical protein F4680DRAFT_448336 [Xylaria scruposa]
MVQIETHAESSIDVHKICGPVFGSLNFAIVLSRSATSHVTITATTTAAAAEAVPPPLSPSLLPPPLSLPPVITIIITTMSAPAPAAGGAPVRPRVRGSALARRNHGARCPESWRQEASLNEWLASLETSHKVDLKKQIAESEANHQKTLEGLETTDFKKHKSALQEVSLETSHKANLKNQEDWLKVSYQKQMENQKASLHAGHNAQIQRPNEEIRGLSNMKRQLGLDDPNARRCASCFEPT